LSTPDDQSWSDQASAQAVGRDMIVVGASAGGIEALTQIVPLLPANLPAAVFVVLHLPTESKSVLPAILGRKSNVRVEHAVDGEPIEHSRVYIAPPDRHLMIEQNQVRLSHGPRENGHRPAIDPLFRTAARTYGSRVVGIILSGNLYDGTLGLRAVKQHGGVSVVQDPADATYTGMPENAIENDDPDHIVAASDVAALIERLAGERVPLTPSGNGDAGENGSREPTGFSCPDCNGGLWVEAEGRDTRFVCRVGHAYSAESLYVQQADAVEAALWTAIRTLQERSELAARLAERLSSGGGGLGAERFRRHANDARRHADAIRTLVEDFDVVAEAGPRQHDVASAAKARGHTVGSE